MFKAFNICAALESVKKIYENNQCTVCDKTGEKFMRYACGHSACESCASDTGDCFFCLTPPDQSTSNYTAFDDVLTQRATNASELLRSFQKAFNVDVQEYQRISRIPKDFLEKEIFPECIQAPIKYYNKRKSLKPSIKKKHNQLSQLPGEIVNPAITTKMENSINSVEKWLDKIKNKLFKNQKVNNKDDSGIVTDVSLIDCSQITEDKDRNALLAVYEADKNELVSVSSTTDESERWSEFHDGELTSEQPKLLKENYKVPFLKKSKLAEASGLRDTYSNIIKIGTNVTENTTNIEITVFNHKQSMRCKDVVKKKVAAHCVPVQTDICDISQIKRNTDYINNMSVLNENKSMESGVEDCSQDIFTSEELCKDTESNMLKNNTKIVAQAIVIEETDSDNSPTEEDLVQEIQRCQSQVIHGVLRSFDSHEEFLNRPRRRPRGLTPDSSNSSDKENLDPNRAKRARYDKKNKKK